MTSATQIFIMFAEELFAAGLGGQELFHLCPHLSEGFQNIVYDQKFWYRENDQRRVLAMNLDTDLIVGKSSTSTTADVPHHFLLSLLLVNGIFKCNVMFCDLM